MGTGLTKNQGGTGPPNCGSFGFGAPDFSVNFESLFLLLDYIESGREMDFLLFVL